MNLITCKTLHFPRRVGASDKFLVIGVALRIHEYGMFGLLLGIAFEVDKMSGPRQSVGAHRAHSPAAVPVRYCVE